MGRGLAKVKRAEVRRGGLWSGRGIVASRDRRDWGGRGEPHAGICAPSDREQGAVGDGFEGLGHGRDDLHGNPEIREVVAGEPSAVALRLPLGVEHEVDLGRSSIIAGEGHALSSAAGLEGGVIQSEREPLPCLDGTAERRGELSGVAIMREGDGNAVHPSGGQGELGSGVEDNLGLGQRDGREFDGGRGGERRYAHVGDDEVEGELVVRERGMGRPDAAIASGLGVEPGIA